MDDVKTKEIMAMVGEQLVDGFGRIAVRPEREGEHQVVSLSGTSYAVAVAMSAPDTITVRCPVGFPDWSQAGIADFLLRENARWIFGRFERIDDALVVEHSTALEGMSAELLQRVVRAVHDVTRETEQVLRATGVLAEA